MLSIIYLFFSFTHSFADEACLPQAKIIRTLKKTIHKIDYRIQKQTASEILIKSREQVPEWKNAFYRFKIKIESFSTRIKASQRSGTYLNPPKDLSPSVKKSFPLRLGFNFNCYFIVSSTDVNKFHIEQGESLNSSLREHLLALEK